MVRVIVTYLFSKSHCSENGERPTDAPGESIHRSPWFTRETVLQVRKQHVSLKDITYFAVTKTSVPKVCFKLLSSDEWKAVCTP